MNFKKEAFAISGYLEGGFGDHCTEILDYKQEAECRQLFLATYSDRCLPVVPQALAFFSTLQHGSTKLAGSRLRLTVWCASAHFVCEPPVEDRQLRQNCASSSAAR